MSRGPRGGLAGSAALMFTGTAVSRALGLVRNAVLALAITVNVAGAANAFAVANKLPNIIYMLVAGGVLNAVLVPQIVRAMRQEDGGKEYVDRLLTMAAAALAALTVVLTLAASLLVRLYGSQLGDWLPVAVAFAYWCIPQLFFYGLYTLLGQVLNARSSFGPYMWAPALNNVIAIAGLGVFLAVYGTSATSGGEDPSVWTADRVALLAGTATLGVVAQALVLFVPLYRSGFRWTLRWGLRGTGLGRTSRVASWAFAALAVGQVGYLAVSNVAAAAGTAGGGSADVAGNAAYDNAFLIFMLPQSLITVSLVTALFTRMSANAAAQEVGKVRADLSLGLRVVGVFTVFASVALAVLALPIARVVLPTVTLAEARSVATVTVAMLLGLAALGAWTLVQRVYYAYEDTRALFLIQIPMAAIVAGGAIVGAFLLDARWWVAGAGFAMSVSTIFGSVVAYLRLRLRLGSLDGGRVLRTHVRLVLAAVSAGAVGWGVLRLLGPGPGDDVGPASVLAGSLVRVVVPGLVMVTVYLLLLRRLHVEELDVLARPARRLLPVLGRRVRTMTRGRSGSPRTEDGRGEGVSVTAVGGEPVVGRGTLLAGRYLLSEPVETDVVRATRWRGHDQVLDREVDTLVLGGETAAEALDAVRRAALVDDARLAHILGVGNHDGAAFVVTEVVRGTDLAGLVRRGPLDPEQARALVGEAASALESARRRGVHHLALRPSALHLTPERQVLVTGLGVDAAQRGHEGGDYVESSRVDAVGLVALLYYALTGRPPASGEAADGATPEVTPPGDLRPGVPNDLDTLCAVTLGPHDDGPRSPADLILELAPWVEITIDPDDSGGGSGGAGGPGGPGGPPHDGPAPEPRGGSAPVPPRARPEAAGFVQPRQGLQETVPAEPSPGAPPAPGRGPGVASSALAAGHATSRTATTLAERADAPAGDAPTANQPGPLPQNGSPANPAPAPPQDARASSTTEAPSPPPPPEPSRRPVSAWSLPAAADVDDDGRPGFDDVLAGGRASSRPRQRPRHARLPDDSDATDTPDADTPGSDGPDAEQAPVAEAPVVAAPAVAPPVVAAPRPEPATSSVPETEQPPAEDEAPPTEQEEAPAEDRGPGRLAVVLTGIAAGAEKILAYLATGARWVLEHVRTAVDAISRRLAVPPDRERRRFDPTPFVLAMMLALVIFAFIWAVNTLIEAATSPGTDPEPSPPGISEVEEPVIEAWSAVVVEPT